MACECVGFCPNAALGVALLGALPLAEAVEDVVEEKEEEEYCF